MMTSHATYQVVGAFWYLFSVESELRCWRRALKNTSHSQDSYLSCEHYNQAFFSLLNNSCKFIDPDDIKDSEFNFGIFLEALKSQIVESTTGFPQKFFYCFWWGLRNLRLDLIFFFLDFHMQDSHFLNFNFCLLT